MSVAMFTVKAQYKNETRKLTFSDLVGPFPTFSQIHSQVTRVFPVSRDFYLSRVLFSEDSSMPDRRILVATKIHNAEEYDTHIARLTKTSAQPLLRFDVVDSMAQDQNSGQLTTDPRYNFQEHYDRFMHPQIWSHVTPPPSLLPQGLMQPTPESTVYSHYSPQYISFEEPSFTATSSMSGTRVATIHASPLRNTDEAQPVSQTAQSDCCAVETGRNEVKALISTFKSDLNTVLSKAFGPGATDLWESSSEASSASRLQLCNMCNKLHPGSEAVCEECRRPGPSSTPQNVSMPRLSTSTVPQERSSSSSQAPKVVHRGIRCDVCNKVPEGIRHKCLDCPDYDLCETCITNGQAELHNPFHEFFDILEPGRVIVHTHRDRDYSPPAPAPSAPEPAIHNATCDLCESLIRGNRYKCATCPDFDTCESCFAITKEQHPGHSFTRLSTSKDLIRARSEEPKMHFATCNECERRVYGIRYKCMHPECPDYDLCESCEALPIAVHPANHPLLKMKTPDTVVPTVYRVGPVDLIPNRLSTIEPQQDAVISSTAAGVPAASLSESSPKLFITPSLEVPVLSSPVIIPPGWNPTEIARTSLSPSAPPLPPKPKFPNGFVLGGPARIVADEYEPDSPVIPGAFQYDFSTPREDALESHKSWKADRGIVQALESALPEQEGSNPEWKDMLSGLEHFLVPEEQDTPLHKGFRVGAYVEESPLNVNTALLSRPKSPAENRENTTLSALLGSYASASSYSSVPQEHGSAVFVADVTVPDGQVFPPGVEFMKCWRMKNDGDQDWPEGTAMAFVGGKEMLKNDHDASFFVGKVKKGETLDLWTGELKAPETPGKYVSYWRLKDAEGNVFGDSVWIDITVAEPNSEDGGSQGMNSSSLIMMPATMEGPTGKSVPSYDGSSARSSAQEDDAGSDSDMSLLSAPSSLSDEDHWETSREAVPRAPEEAEEYVVLFDESSSSEED